jgi:hypothetical protein
MKLTKELKERIDNYFNNISAEELYDLAVTKYSFEEEEKIEIELDNQSFCTVRPSYYSSELDNSIDVEAPDNLPFAA